MCDRVIHAPRGGELHAEIAMRDDIARVVLQGQLVLAHRSFGIARAREDRAQPVMSDRVRRIDRQRRVIMLTGLVVAALLRQLERKIVVREMVVARDGQCVREKRLAVLPMIDLLRVPIDIAISTAAATVASVTRLRRSSNQRCGTAHAATITRPIIGMYVKRSAIDCAPDCTSPIIGIIAPQNHSHPPSATASACAGAALAPSPLPT